MPEGQIHIIAIPIDDRDDFMHVADLFEPNKRLVGPAMSIRGTINDGETASSCLEKTRKALLELSGKKWAAIFIPGAPGGWRDPTIKYVSNGDSWGLFWDRLVLMGFVGANQNE